MDMKLKAKIYLENSNDKFMGIGVLWLLKALDKNPSLRSAASELGLSYSKAYNMIKNLEDSLGKQIIERKKGGKDHEGSKLTPFAVSFITLYDDFQNKCKYLLEKPFEEFSKELEKLKTEN